MFMSVELSEIERVLKCGDYRLFRRYATGDQAQAGESAGSEHGINLGLGGVDVAEIQKVAMSIGKDDVRRDGKLVPVLFDGVIGLFERDAEDLGGIVIAESKSEALD